MSRSVRPDVTGDDLDAIVALARRRERRSRRRRSRGSARRRSGRPAGRGRHSCFGPIGRGRAARGQQGVRARGVRRGGNRDGEGPRVRGRRVGDGVCRVARRPTSSSRPMGSPCGKGVDDVHDRCRRRGCTARCPRRRTLWRRPAGASSSRSGSTGVEASVFALCDGERLRAAACGARPQARLRRRHRAEHGRHGRVLARRRAGRRCARGTSAMPIVAPVLAEMAARGAPFRGALFVGLMLTTDGPRVLEFNVRFGDPETQAIMPRLDVPLAELMLECAQGRLSTTGTAADACRTATVAALPCRGRISGLWPARRCGITGSRPRVNAARSFSAPASHATRTAGSSPRWPRADRRRPRHGRRDGSRRSVRRSRARLSTPASGYAATSAVRLVAAIA